MYECLLTLQMNFNSTQETGTIVDELTQQCRSGRFIAELLSSHRRPMT
jgi:hypothetical protein